MIGVLRSHRAPANLTQRAAGAGGLVEDYRHSDRLSGDPNEGAAAADRRAARARRDAQADCRALGDRRGGHRPGRGLRLRRAAGGGECHRGEPGAAAGRPGPRRESRAGGPDAPGHDDLRPARPRDVRDQRRRDRAVGPARQGARRAGVRAARAEPPGRGCRAYASLVRYARRRTSRRPAATSSRRASAMLKLHQIDVASVGRRARRSARTSS